jgi:hypothetical protein
MCSNRRTSEIMKLLSLEDVGGSFYKSLRSFRIRFNAISLPCPSPTNDIATNEARLKSKPTQTNPMEGIGRKDLLEGGAAVGSATEGGPAVGSGTAGDNGCCVALPVDPCDIRFVHRLFVLYTGNCLLVRARLHEDHRPRRAVVRRRPHRLPHRPCPCHCAQKGCDTCIVDLE